MRIPKKMLLLLCLTFVLSSFPFSALAEEANSDGGSTGSKVQVVLSQTYIDNARWENVFGGTNGWGDDFFVLNWTGGWLKIILEDCCLIGDFYSVWIVNQTIGPLSLVGTTPEVETDPNHVCSYGPHTGNGTVLSEGRFLIWLSAGTYEFRVRNELFQILAGVVPTVPPCNGTTTGPPSLDGWSPAGFDIGFHIPVPGDVNCDGIVNIQDVVIVALAFGSKPSDPNWNPKADINQDGKVTICDLVITGVNFGNTGP